MLDQLINVLNQDTDELYPKTLTEIEPQYTPVAGLGPPSVGRIADLTTRTPCGAGCRM